MNKSLIALSLALVLTVPAQASPLSLAAKVKHVAVVAAKVVVDTGKLEYRLAKAVAMTEVLFFVLLSDDAKQRLAK